MDTKEILAPQYGEILKEVGTHLSDRKAALLKRTLLITWPVLVLIAGIYVLSDIYNSSPLLAQYPILMTSLGFALFAAAALYTFVTSFTFEIEKHIWVDSYFDKKNLSLDESWNISKKLFWSAIKFRVDIFTQYYLKPFVGVALIVMSWIIWMTSQTLATNGNSSQIMLVSFVGLIAVLIFFFAYGYYLRTKLRYSWFLFLDTYGSSSAFDLQTEMNRLNDISKSDSFKKSLMLTIGADSAEALTRITIGSINAGMSQLGGPARMIGSLLQVYGNEASRQVTTFGNITAQYILYRFARKMLYNEEQVVNENIYRL